MNHRTVAVSVFLLALGLPACTSDAVKRGAYEALYQKDCMDRIGAPDCDPEHEGYDEYRKDREDALRRDR